MRRLGDKLLMVIILGVLMFGAVLFVSIGLLHQAGAVPETRERFRDWEWSEDDITETKRRGEVLAAALLRHRDDRGTFPATLEELVPDYLPIISRPTTASIEWGYASRGESAALWFCLGLGCYPSHIWKSDMQVGHWLFDG